MLSAKSPQHVFLIIRPMAPFTVHRTSKCGSEAEPMCNAPDPPIQMAHLHRPTLVLRLLRLLRFRGETSFPDGIRAPCRSAAATSHSGQRKTHGFARSLSRGLPYPQSLSARKQSRTLSASYPPQFLGASPKHTRPRHQAPAIDNPAPFLTLHHVLDAHGVPIWTWTRAFRALNFGCRHAFV